MTKKVWAFITWLILLLAWSVFMGFVQPPILVNIILSFVFGFVMTGFILEIFDIYEEL